VNRPPGVHVKPLTIEHLDEILEYWREAHPLHPMDAGLLRERLFESGRSDPELILAARDDGGRLVGMVRGDYPGGLAADAAGVRWLGVAPDWAEKGVETTLLDALVERLTRRGACKIYMLASPPYYLRPGVDTRETGLIATLLRLGWEHERTVFNMTVELARWAMPGPDRIFGQDRSGYEVRRAMPTDEPPLSDLILRHWTRNWLEECRLAFRHDPIKLFVATLGEEIVGFVAHEVNQCLGSYGPTGVAPFHRGTGLGRRLLWASLGELKRLGRPVCEIGWVGPVAFYHRACGATLGPVYWVLKKDVVPEG